MVEQNDKHVTFRVSCPEAVRVFLVGDFEHRGSEVHGMDRVGGDTWQARMELAPGEYHFCYYLYDGRTIRYQPSESPLGDDAIDGTKTVLRVGTRG